MYRNKIAQIIEAAILKTFPENGESLKSKVLNSIQLSTNEDYGDYSSVIAIRIAKLLNSDPYTVAEKIVDSIEHLPPFCQAIRTAANGFINISLRKDAYFYGILSILHKKENVLTPALSEGESVMVLASDSITALSLNINDGRRLSIAAFFKYLLSKTGYKSYALNIVRDSGESLWRFAATVEHHYREFLGDAAQSYFSPSRSRYAVETAREVIDNYAADFLPISKSHRISVMHSESPSITFRRLKEVYRSLGVDSGEIRLTSKSSELRHMISEIERFFKERDLLYSESIVKFPDWVASYTPEAKRPVDERARISNRCDLKSEYQYWNFDHFKKMKEVASQVKERQSLIYAHEEQVWLRNTAFGDDEDRIFYLPGREPSDFLITLATVLMAIKKKFSKLLILTPAYNSLDIYDKISLVLNYMGYKNEIIQVVTVEKVSVLSLDQDPDPIKGESQDLPPLIEKLGNVKLMLSYLAKPPLTPLSIDCKHVASDEEVSMRINTAFDRMKNIFKISTARELVPSISKLSESIDMQDLKLLTDKREMELIQRCIKYHSIVSDTVNNFNPSILINYIAALSDDFNDYYCSVKILSGDKSLVKARLALVAAVKTVLVAALSLFSLKI